MNKPNYEKIEWYNCKIYEYMDGTNSTKIEIKYQAGIDGENFTNHSHGFTMNITDNKVKKSIRLKLIQNTTQKLFVYFNTVLEKTDTNQTFSNISINFGKQSISSDYNSSKNICVTFKDPDSDCESVSVSFFNKNDFSRFCGFFRQFSENQLSLDASHLNTACISRLMAKIDRIGQTDQNTKQSFNMIIPSNSGVMKAGPIGVQENDPVKTTGKSIAAEISSMDVVVSEKVKTGGVSCEFPFLSGFASMDPDSVYTWLSAVSTMPEEGKGRFKPLENILQRSFGDKYIYEALCGYVENMDGFELFIEKYLKYIDKTILITGKPPKPNRWWVMGGEWIFKPNAECRFFLYDMIVYYYMLFFICNRLVKMGKTDLTNPEMMEVFRAENFFKVILNFIYNIINDELFETGCSEKFERIVNNGVFSSKMAYRLSKLSGVENVCPFTLDNFKLFLRSFKAAYEKIERVKWVDVDVDTAVDYILE